MEWSMVSVVGRLYTSMRTFDRFAVVSFNLSTCYSYETAAMKALRTAIFLCIIGFAFADSNVATAFKQAKIQPDILDEVPSELITVKFGDQNVDLGNELTPTEVKDKPEIHYNHESGVLYTLVMTDPDAPSRESPTWREWHHWLVVNIPGDKISEGEVLSEFISSAPPKDTGLHRYVYLVYKQPGKIEFDEQRLTDRSGAGRERFSTKKFAAKYNLGNPIAGNYYQAQYDDYVPSVHERLGA